MRMATLHEFVAAPVGRWAHAAPLLVWAATPRLCGISYTGLITAADVPQLRALTSLPVHPAFDRPYRAVLDCTGIIGLDVAAFALLVEHVRDMAATQRLFERVAVVRPAGITGAALVGLFHDYVAPKIDLLFVDDLESAIRVVGGDDYRDELLELRDV